MSSDMRQFGRVAKDCQSDRSRNFEISIEFKILVNQLRNSNQQPVLGEGQSFGNWLTVTKSHRIR